MYGSGASYEYWPEFGQGMNFLETLATRHTFHYAIGWGTMLASIRHEQGPGCGNCIIPLDNDADVWVFKSGVEILLKLARDPSVPSVVFSNNLTRSTHPRRQNGVKIVMYPLHEYNPWNAKYITSEGKWMGRRLGVKPPRWTCTGRKVPGIRDPCSFDGPVGRVVIRNKWIDIFPWYAQGPKINGGDCTKYRKGYICIFHQWNVSYMPLPETEPYECNGVKTRRFKDVKLMHEVASSMYGKNGHMLSIQRYSMRRGWRKIPHER